MFWKCIHDLFGYCKTEPDGAAKTLENESEILRKVGHGATCSLDPKTCGLHMTCNEVYPEKIGWEEPSTLITRIVADKHAKADKGEQGSML